MSTSRRPRRPIGSSIARGVVVLAALAGLFAMHGLSEHGVSGHAATDRSSTELMAFVMADVHRHHLGTQSLAEAPTTSTARHVGMAMGACLAVLLAAGLVWPRDSKARTWHWMAGQQRRCRDVPARARAPDPPDLSRLSVQRC